MTAARRLWGWGQAVFHAVAPATNAAADLGQQVVQAPEQVQAATDFQLQAVLAPAEKAGCDAVGPAAQLLQAALLGALVTLQQRSGSLLTRACTVAVPIPGRIPRRQRSYWRTGPAAWPAPPPPVPRSGSGHCSGNWLKRRQSHRLTTSPRVAGDMSGRYKTHYELNTVHIYSISRSGGPVQPAGAPPQCTILVSRCYIMLRESAPVPLMQIAVVNEKK